MVTFEIFIGISMLLLALAISGWVLSVVIKDASLVDVMWPLFFVYYTLAYTFLTIPTDPFLLVFICLIFVWGMRLSIYLGWRNFVDGKGEDNRYAHIRYAIGEGFWWKSLFVIFLLQLILASIVALPIVGVLAQYQAFYMLSTEIELGLKIVALFIIAIGVVWEIFADNQLSHFLSDSENKGKVMNTGLWKYHRHPNYFGEWLVWVGINMFAIVQGYIWCIPSVILMTWLLMNFSGVKRLERYVGKREGYAEYQKTTPAFFPKFK